MTREDVKSDASLHKVVEKLINIRNKGVLTMDDYKMIAQLKEQYMPEAVEKKEKTIKVKTLPPELAPQKDPKDVEGVRDHGFSAFYDQVEKAKKENVDFSFKDYINYNLKRDK